MTENQVVTKYLELKQEFYKLNYTFALLTPDYGFTAYNGEDTLKFVNLSHAEDELVKLRSRV